jgi:triosephosphate isomerase
MNPLIIANWKMNLTLDEAVNFISKLEKTIIPSISYTMIAPPIAYITRLQELSGKITFCAQDISVFSGEGAYTGELSAKMIKSCGINYSIINHSERREHFKEDNKIARIKIKNCLEAGITPVVCFGETGEEREQGKYKEVLLKQINELLPRSSRNIILAYEPLWSIGSGTVASVREIAEIANFIQDNKQALIAKNLSLVYGGSVSSKSYKDIVTIPGIKGVLVGKASLNIDELTNMINSRL